MRAFNWVLALVVGLGCGAPLLAHAEQDTECPAERIAPIALPHLKQALAHNQDVTIIALGSSSTAGYHSSNVAHTYPAILQEELEKALPSAHIAVLNRGIGGQDAVEELARIDKDVLATGPTVVIWQLGANGAMRNSDPQVFKRLVAEGVRRMLGAGLDVVLMDNQRAPAILASPEHVQIEQALADVATATGAGLFSRGLLMDEWQHDGFPYRRFVSDDGLHHNDLGYDCIAKALAAAITTGIGPDSKVASAHSTSSQR